MKTELLKFLGVILAALAAVYIIAKAIIEWKKIESSTQLTALKLEHEHKEMLSDKLINYHRQAFGSSRTVIFHDNFSSI